MVIATGAIVTAGDDAQELTLGSAVVGDRHGGVTGLLLELDDLLHGHVGGQRRIGLNKASLVILDGLDHSGLGLGALRTVNEGQATLGSERDTHVDARDGLHDGGNHGDVQGDCRLLTALKTGQRRLKRDVVGDALRGRVTRDQQILRKRVGLTGKERSHVSPFSMRPVGCRPRRTQPNLGRPILGKNRLEPIPHIIGAAMRFGGGMAVVMFLIVRLAPEQLLNLLSNDPLVIA